MWLLWLTGPYRRWARLNLGARLVALESMVGQCGERLPRYAQEVTREESASGSIE